LMITLITVLLGMLVVTFKAEGVEAAVTIHIKADGSIDPSYASIRRDGDLYVLTDNVSGVVIERNNMTLDGRGLTVQGSQASSYEGIYVYGRSNVTIKNINVAGFYHGVWLDSSSNSSISNSNVEANRETGIVLSTGSQNIRIVENNITANREAGIFLLGSSSHNSIIDNTITTNNYGISLYLSSNNSIYGNNILSNNCGVRLQACSNNSIYHNNFVNNTNQVYAVESTNIWDDGYPSGGNYWSNYAGLDSNRGVGQNQTGRDGIGDIPCVIDMNNTDRYPLMTEYISVIPEFSPFLILLLLITSTLILVVAHRVKRSVCKYTISGFPECPRSAQLTANENKALFNVIRRWFEECSRNRL
jgi:parallel beta-helix repeat protein